ncbi:MAG TPA: hypothetical protein VHN98_09980, partial [Acidimicrobiales bacterium]|nr:hypothetical protein [Acidimicrobiales bacterium]
RVVPAGPIWNARLLPFWYLLLYFLAAIAVAEGAILLGTAVRPHHVAAGGLAPERAGEGSETIGTVVAPPPGLDELRPTPLGESRPAPLAEAILAIGALVIAVIFTGIPLGVFSGQLVLPGGATLPFLRMTATKSSFVPAWAKWNYSGYERKASYPEYHDVVTTMADVGKKYGCGRAMWEYEPELNRFGTPMALMLLPHWTDGCIGSMEGLYFESSATVPYHFLNQSELSKSPSRAMRNLPYRNLDVDAGVEHLQMLGVKYYMAISPEAQAQAQANPTLRLIASTKPQAVNYTDGTKQRFWQIYEVRDAALVTPLAYDPVVVRSGMDGKTSWLQGSVAWYTTPSAWDVPLATDGPASWPRIPNRRDIAPPEPVARTVHVSDIRTSDDRISFRVDQPGTPVLVKVSYFPNWKASGAKGPWRVTPNLMVVIPTSTKVDLHYGWTGVDILGWLVSLVALAGVAYVSLRPVRMPEPPRPAEEFVDPFYVPPVDDDPLVASGTRDAP